MNPELILTAIIIAISVFFYVVLQKHKKDNSFITAQNNTLKSEIEKFKLNMQQQTGEKEKFEADKNKIEEKNKKMMTMSQTVYNEKRKVDEALELLKTEKEKLEADKKRLDEKLKKLWAATTTVQKEKEKINHIKIEIEEKHKEVMDSVTYAQRIQEAILPSISAVRKTFNDSFILFKPKDIVSGDFYWFSQKGNLNILASVDCTGHGVPGAFMSMIGNTLLNQIVNEKGITDPAEILDNLNEEVSYSLKQDQEGSESRDGMDIAICCFNLQEMTMEYAGANRPLYYVRDCVLEEIKANKFPIGGLEYDIPKKFTKNIFQLQSKDTIYISTDGFADQFNREDKKLMTRKFKETLVSINGMAMNEQSAYLNRYIENWKGGMEQTDDILVIGVRV